MPMIFKAPHVPKWLQASVIPITFHQPSEAAPLGGEERVETSWATCLARQQRKAESVTTKGSSEHSGGPGVNEYYLATGGKVTAEASG